MGSSPQIIQVRLKETYQVHVQSGLLRQAGDIVAGLTGSRKLGIVTDEQVAPCHLPTLVRSLETAGFEPIVCTLPAGETHKTLASISRIYDTFLPARMDRSTPLLSLGGGVICDMTGFAAATILRGVPLIQIPTTLLSMVDASVGGKTGIDHACGKNLIGAFHQPAAVLVDPQVLQTLPQRELVGGLAECIKHDIIRDGAHFEELPRIIREALGLDMASLTALLAHNIAIKARVVEADPFEKGERAHLNFGHTFGHAIETISNYRYSHGESVSLGMVAAARCACELHLLAPRDAARIVAVCAAAGLPTGGLTLDLDAVLDAMAFDKKVQGKCIRFVLPDRIGHVIIRDDVPPPVVRKAVESLRS